MIKYININGEKFMTTNELFGELDATEKKKAKRGQPELYNVYMHNDDYTTMEFVVLMLETIFRKSSTEAHTIMMNIHLKGVGLCGVFPLEIAETKVTKVHSRARKDGFPLRCSVKRELNV